MRAVDVANLLIVVAQTFYTEILMTTERTAQSETWYNTDVSQSYAI